MKRDDPPLPQTVPIEEYRRVVARCIELGEKVAAINNETTQQSYQRAIDPVRQGMLHYENRDRLALEEHLRKLVDEITRLRFTNRC